MAEKQKGKINKWNDEKGYGFIQPDDRSNNIFLHISGLNNNRRPRVGDRISYQLERDRSNRICAKNAQLEGVLPSGMNLGSLLIMLICPITLGWGLGINYFTVSLLWYSFINTVTFLVYGNDKHRAKQDKWRISENKLHTLELLGGFTGALIAQEHYRHKSKKISYRIGFWFMVFLHVFAVFYLTFNGK